MAQGGRLMGFQDIRVQFSNFSAAHRLEEIGEMTFRLPLEGTNQLAFQIEERSIGNDSLGSYKNPTVFKLGIKRLSFQPARLRHDRLAPEVIDYHLSVRRLGGIGVANAP